MKLICMCSRKTYARENSGGICGSKTSAPLLCKKVPLLSGNKGTFCIKKILMNDHFFGTALFICKNPDQHHLVMQIQV